MPVEAQAQAPIGGVKPELGKSKNVLFTVRNITPAVYLTGQYNARPEEKAVELSRLIDGLLDLGIWPSAAEAFRAGIPVGTFVLVDDKSLSQPKEAAGAVEKNVRVEVVKRVKIIAVPV